MTRRVAIFIAVLAAIAVPIQGQRPEPPDRDPFRFRGGVEFVGVHATITDASGRFVSGLRKEDFAVYEDDQRVEVTHFSVDRVPVSLGLALDTSSSMAGDKIKAARRAIEELLGQLVAGEDEMLLYRFGDFPILVQAWTADRRLIGRALERIEPTGGTAMYDTIAQALPLVDTGRNPKKALIVVSDGNDTSSGIELPDLKQRIRESEALVYAVGIDGQDVPAFRPRPRRQRRPPPRLPFPTPFAPGGSGRGGFLQLLPGNQGASGSSARSRGNDPANVAALRDLTDDSGGRTEVIGELRQLERTVAAIADEMGRQYYLGYASPGQKNGRWRSIRVEVRDLAHHVRARRGYIAN
ncbi:MAG: hypothetical protein A3G76_01555 [Acidobacteria bacterium RIFCSPLOWO2_12_FULL_65_11]|nr:MAG: hypothetical protein A3H95_03950 [Acidobacteria bacterium RIFCSPLOWO2_02_FULL_64_15]OFW28833.1 MAG: hypothetical protein A3G76_01555 [Acidobacteria bacterium RIFCSPLOWO2_12_FULL_65_11]